MSLDPLVSDGDPIAPLVEDFLERLRRGERPDVAEYAARYPEHAGRIAELLPALELMERLKPGPDSCTVIADGRPAAAPADEGEGPQRLGDYLIVRELGRGGMGVVYEAVQESLGRHVALKVLPGYAQPGSAQRERFRLEARSVARLHHTNIVPVFAVGEHEGVPYYAMQFIAGQSLEAVLDALRRLRAEADPAGSAATAGDGAPSIAHALLSGQFGAKPAAPAAPTDPGAATAEGGPPSGLSGTDPRGDFRAMARLGLQVAEALAHAHDRGVLHRDIKPSNLLLDPDGRAWVTDFGLAKLEGADGPTRTGDVVGTLRYMAPERFEGRSDPRSDVYALGVTLYELLTLRPAFDAASRAGLVEQVLRAEPAAPRRLDPRVPRDLETVVLKAMAKGPADRYATAQALAEDLRRFLEDRPIRARRAGAAERAWRWCRRNPAVAGLLGAVIVSLAAGTAISTMQAIRARAKASEAQAVLKFFRDRVLAAARPEGQEGGLRRDVTLRAALDAAEPEIAGAFKDQPVIEAEIRATLGATYQYLGEAPLAICQLERAVELYWTKLGPDHPDTLASRNILASTYREAGRIFEAVALHEYVLKLQEEKLGPDHPDTFASRNNLALAYWSAGRTAEAIALYKDVLNRQQARLGANHPDTLTLKNNLALAYQAAGRLPDALPLFEETVRGRKAELGPDHPLTLNAINNLVTAYLEAGRTAEVITLYEDALKRQEVKLGANHPETLATRNNLALAYQADGRLVDALDRFKENLEAIRAKLGPDHPYTMGALSTLAGAYRAMGRFADVLPLLEEALKRRRATLGDDHPDTLTSMNNLAMGYRDAGRLTKALGLFEETLEQSKAKLGADHPDTLVSMTNLATAYLDAGRLVDARPLFEKAMEGFKAKLEANHPRTLNATNKLARAYLADKPAEAERLLRGALAILERKLPDDWSTFETRSLLGGSLLGQGRYAEAKPLVVSGYEGLKAREAKIPAPGKGRLAEAAERVVRLYEAWGKSEEATAWKRKLGLADLPADVFTP